jgi:hypothetical protein
MTGGNVTGVLGHFCPAFSVKSIPALTKAEKQDRRFPLLRYERQLFVFQTGIAIAID